MSTKGNGDGQTGMHGLVVYLALRQCLFEFPDASGSDFGTFDFQVQEPRKLFQVNHTGVSDFRAIEPKRFELGQPFKVN